LPASDRGKCAQHAAQRERERGSASSRGYDVKWRRSRAAYLAEHPCCVVCGDGTPATEVDHVIPLERGGTDDWYNRQALCKPHHSAKTMRESVRG